MQVAQAIDRVNLPNGPSTDACSALAGLRFGQALEHHEVIDSTNERALVLGQKGAPEGLVVVADTQTSGRGRRGRRWLDQPGGALLFSLLLRPRFPASAWPLLGLATAVAAARGLREVSSVPVRVKWPNDLVVDYQEGPGPCKVGGILLETDTASRFLVVGVGVNLTAAPEVEPGPAGLRAASIAEWAPAPLPARPVILGAILAALEPLYRELEAGRAGVILTAFEELDITSGRPVTLQVGGEVVVGTAAGLDETGALRVRTPTGMRTFAAGDARLLGHERGEAG